MDTDINFTNKRSCLCIEINKLILTLAQYRTLWTLRELEQVAVFLTLDSNILYSNFKHRFNYLTSEGRGPPEAILVFCPRCHYANRLAYQLNISINSTTEIPCLNISISFVFVVYSTWAHKWLLNLRVNEYKDDYRFGFCLSVMLENEEISAPISRVVINFTRFRI